MTDYCARCPATVDGLCPTPWVHLAPYRPPVVMEYCGPGLKEEEYRRLREWAEENNVDARVPPALRPPFPEYVPAYHESPGVDVDGYRPYIIIAGIVGVITGLMLIVAQVLS